MQRAHVIANRLSGREKRYKGVRNAFNDKEWKILIEQLGSEFKLTPDLGFELAKKTMAKLWFPMCAECHQEVLSEPFYLESFLDGLLPHFEGKSRTDKMLILSEILGLGLNAYNRRVRSG